MRKARVFISCGQKNEKETKVGIQIQEYFKKREFETYFAEKVHSSDGLTQNIFKFLKQSEYFVFVDFKRDKLNENEYRGSLFVNQEIAISTFLELPGIGFLEEGVKREGVLQYHIYNAINFIKVDDIIRALDIETKDWENDSVNELAINYEPSLITKGIPIINYENHPLSDWYHIEVINRNKKKHALDCRGYVTKIKNLNSNKDLEIPSRELMWAGFGDISANIIAGTKKELDALYIIHGEQKIRFPARPSTTTNPRYNLPDLQKGKYLIEYTVISSNFETVSAEFILDFDGNHENIKFNKVEIQSK